MIRGITFDKQLLKSGDHAHEVNHFYQGSMGVTKGCAVSENVDGNLVVADGYFMVYGRLTANEGDEVVTVPSVASGTLYSILVYEIDLTKENTIETFSQGAFKIVSDSVAYPTLTQEDLDDAGSVYQMEFARFENTVSGIANLTDTRTILDMTKYVEKTTFDSHLAESANKHISEWGANENGRYVKWDDGTAIVSKRVGFITINPAAEYVGASPIAFIPGTASAFFSATPNTGAVRAKLHNLAINEISSTGMTSEFRVINNADIAMVVALHLVAIGRWK